MGVKLFYNIFFQLKLLKLLHQPLIYILIVATCPFMSKMCQMLEVAIAHSIA